MPSLWLKKLVLAAALAVMPLQGVAAALSALLCHGEAQTHAAHAGGKTVARAAIALSRISGKLDVVRVQGIVSHRGRRLRRGE